MCGIVGICYNRPVNQLLYDALLLLQHRGQDAAGMATLNQGKFYLHKRNAMVSDVFKNRDMLNLQGNLGIGHVRYPTAGDNASEEEAQPFYVNAPFGIAFAHNGNLTNTQQLKAQLLEDERRHINTSSDSEVLLNVLAYELDLVSRNKNQLTAADIFVAVNALHKRVRGSYAVVALIAGHGLLAFRDPNGIRPLCMGHATDDGKAKIFASESVAIEGIDFQFERDIAPGEAVFIAQDGTMYAEQCATNPQLHTCVFEYVYFARPDSTIDQISVYQARLALGKGLAKRVLSSMPLDEIDVVMPIPDSSRPSALQLARSIDKPYREGFVKNRYVGRTFIMPGQEVRKKSVRQKLNAIKAEFHNKRVLLVDDSIVRGTTSKQIVQMAREAGATKVYMASAAPPVMYPNVYGIDMPSIGELIANGKSIEQIQQIIGCDKLFFQDLNTMKKLLAELNPQVDSFDCSCFDAQYITGDIDITQFK